MKYYFLALFVCMSSISCKSRQTESITKDSGDIVTQDQVSSYWIKFLQDPASFFPDVIQISDDIQIPKSAITDYTIEYRNDRYNYSQIAGRQVFLLLDGGDVLSMFCDGQNTMKEQLVGGGWEGELIYRMKSFMAPKFFEVRRFIPSDSQSARVKKIVNEWKTVTSQGKEFVYRVFTDNAKEKFVIQVVGRLEAKSAESMDTFISVSDPQVYDLLENSIAQKLQVDTNEVRKMFEARLLSRVSSSKKTHTLGRYFDSETTQWHPSRL